MYKHEIYLNYSTLRDLVADIRFCRRCINAGLHAAENAKYEKLCINDFRKLWYQRKTFPLNQYGYPKDLEH